MRRGGEVEWIGGGGKPEKKGNAPGSPASQVLFTCPISLFIAYPPSPRLLYDILGLVERGSASSAGFRSGVKGNAPEREEGRGGVNRGTGSQLEQPRAGTPRFPLPGDVRVGR